MIPLSYVMKIIVSWLLSKLKLGIRANSILLEHIGRNAAPAITVASIKASQRNKDSTLLVLPADPVIEDEDTFIKTINKAQEYGNRGAIVTFGITPTKAETGYGYIESENQLDCENLNGERIIRFIEKPDKQNAFKFITDKRFTWNSGIFCFKTKDFLNQILIHCPDIYTFCKKSLAKNLFDLEFQN